nr:hypothetical protein [Paraburkholderia sp. BL6669N2]
MHDAAIAVITGRQVTTRSLRDRVASGLEPGVLKIVLADYELGLVPVHVVHREGQHVNQKVRSFPDIAIETFRTRASI